MQDLKIIIHGCPKTKKNHSQIIKAGNKRMVIPSKQYQAFEENFLADCMEQRA